MKWANLALSLRVSKSIALKPDWFWHRSSKQENCSLETVGDLKQWEAQIINYPVNIYSHFWYPLSLVILPLANNLGRNGLSSSLSSLMSPPDEKLPWHDGSPSARGGVGGGVGGHAPFGHFSPLRPRYSLPFEPICFKPYHYQWYFIFSCSIFIS